MVIFHNMHSCPSKHGIHKISSLSGNYGNNLHVRLTLDFLVIFPNACYTVWNGDTDQAAASRECMMINLCHTVRNSDACQAAAFRESKHIYCCYTVWNSDVCQAAAILECTNINPCHTVWNGDACQVAASREYFKY